MEGDVFLAFHLTFEEIEFPKIRPRQHDREDHGVALDSIGEVDPDELAKAKGEGQ